MAGYVPSLNLYGMLSGLGDTIAESQKNQDLKDQAQALLNPSQPVVQQNFVQRLISGLTGDQPQPTVQQALGPAGAPAAVPSTTATVSGAAPAGQDASTPRGLRNNNPGNIEDGPFAKTLPGYAGSDGRFAKFDTIDNGVNAQSNLLASYGNKGINTVSGVVNRWAPQAENGSATGNYTNFVANKLGVGPNDPIDLSNPQTRQRLAYAMGEFENGRPIPQAGQPIKLAGPYPTSDTQGAPTPTAPPIQSTGSTVTPNGHVIPDYSLDRINAMIQNPYTKTLGEALLKRYLDQAPTGKLVTLTGDARAAEGIPADDTRVWQKNTQTGELIPKTESKKDESANKTHVVGPGSALVGPDGKVLYKGDTGGSMPDQTADFLAERVLAGDRQALVGLGRGAQGAENLTKIQTLVAQKAAARGMDPKDILENIAEQAGLSAQQRTFGTQVARMATASTEAQGAIALARQASAEVPRTSLLPWNKMVQAYESGTGDPKLAKFVAANLTVMNTFARAINPNGVPHVQDKLEYHVENLLSTANSPEAYNGVMDQLQAEIDLAHKSPQVAQQMLKNIRKGNDPMEGIKQVPVSPQEGPLTPAEPMQTPKLGSVQIPIPAANYLKQNPNLRQQFDQKYGAGASDRVLGPAQ